MSAGRLCCTLFCGNKTTKDPRNIVKLCKRSIMSHIVLLTEWTRKLQCLPGATITAKYLSTVYTIPDFKSKKNCEQYLGKIF